MEDKFTDAQILEYPLVISFQSERKKHKKSPSSGRGFLIWVKVLLSVYSSTSSIGT